MSPADREAADAMFLANHPAWTWQALQDTPYRVVALLNEIDTVRASKK